MVKIDLIVRVRWRSTPELHLGYYGTYNCEAWT